VIDPITAADLHPGYVLNVLNNDTDPDNDYIHVTAILGPPAYGKAEIIQNGKAIRYTPNIGFGGKNDIIYYQISDGKDGTDASWLSSLFSR